MLKNTLVIGASTKKERYSYRVIEKLIDKNYKVYALGNKKGLIDDVIIYSNFEEQCKLWNSLMLILIDNQNKHNL